jgi:hypothetical protein
VNEPAGELAPSIQASAILDDAHIGHIHGAFGTILYGDHGPRIGWLARIKTLLAILGPGLIVMVGDNDAGAFGTYTQAGQNYGTTLLWTLMLLIPVLYVNQEIVLRLGAFSVIDLFLLNTLTIVTEFIGPLASTELEIGYLVAITCRSPDEAHIRALLLQSLASTGLALRRLESNDLNGSGRVIVSAFVTAHQRVDTGVEETVGRLSLEPTVSAAP